MRVVAKVMQLGCGADRIPPLYNVHVIVEGKVVASVWGDKVDESQGMVQVYEKGSLRASIFSTKIIHTRNWEPVYTGSPSSVCKNVRLGMEEW